MTLFLSICLGLSAALLLVASAPWHWVAWHLTGLRLQSVTERTVAQDKAKA